MRSNNFTALNQFLQCERRFYYERMAGRRTPENMYTQLGSLYHECFARAASGGAVLPTAGLPQAAHIVDHFLIPRAAAPGWIVPMPLDKLREEMVANVARVQEQVLPRLAPIVAVERAHASEHFRGKLDVVAGVVPLLDCDGEGIVGAKPGLCVVDWKVVFSARRREQRAAEHSAQLALYCLLAKCSDAMFVEIPRDVRAPLHFVAAHFEPEDLARWNRYLRAQFSAADARGPQEEAYRLAEAGHPLCCERFCPHWRGCPGGSNEKTT